MYYAPPCVYLVFPKSIEDTLVHLVWSLGQENIIQQFHVCSWPPKPSGLGSILLYCTDGVRRIKALGFWFSNVPILHCKLVNCKFVKEKLVPYFSTVQ